MFEGYYRVNQDYFNNFVWKVTSWILSLSIRLVDVSILHPSEPSLMVTLDEFIF